MPAPGAGGRGGGKGKGSGKEFQAESTLSVESDMGLDLTTLRS